MARYWGSTAVHIDAGPGDEEACLVSLPAYCAQYEELACKFGIPSSPPGDRGGGGCTR